MCNKGFGIVFTSQFDAIDHITFDSTRHCYAIFPTAEIRFAGAKHRESPFKLDRTRCIWAMINIGLVPALAWAIFLFSLSIR